MLKSYKKLNRQSGRITFLEYDPLLGWLQISGPAPAETVSRPLVVYDVDLGDLAFSPVKSGNPRRATAPPRSRKTGGRTDV